MKLYTYVAQINTCGNRIDSYNIKSLYPITSDNFEYKVGDKVTVTGYHSDKILEILEIKDEKDIGVNITQTVIGKVTVDTSAYDRIKVIRHEYDNIKSDVKASRKNMILAYQKIPLEERLAAIDEYQNKRNEVSDYIIARNKYKESKEMLDIFEIEFNWR